MDRLKIFGLCSLFYLCGPMATFLSMICLLFSNQLDLNYISLFCLNLLLTDSLYGLSGIIYNFLSCLTIVTCGAMYWYDWSLSDLKQLIESLNPGTIQCDGIMANENVVKFNDTLGSYFTKSVERFYQVTNLTDEKIAKYKNTYLECSKKFDSMTDIMWRCMCNFYEMTRETKGFKNVYSCLFIVTGIIQSVGMIKSVHKLSRNLPQSSHQSNNDANHLMSDANDMNQMMNFNQMMDFNQMNQCLSNMSPEQKESMEEMTKQILHNVNMNDMMSMIQGLGNLMDPGILEGPGIKKGKSENKNQK
jgi:hypothetical protein